MKTIFTKKKFVLFILVSVIFPLLYAYNKLKEYKLSKNCSEDVVMCHCCGKWRRESETVTYLYNNDNYIVCPVGQSTDTKQLNFALDKNKYIKYLSPF